MRVLIDGQELSAPEIERGIGKVFRMILYHLVNGDVAHDWFLAVREPKHLEYRKAVIPLDKPESRLPYTRAANKFIGAVLMESSLILLLRRSGLRSIGTPIR